MSHEIPRTHSALVPPSILTQETQESLQARVRYLEAMLLALEARVYELDKKTPMVIAVSSGTAIRNSDLLCKRPDTFWLQPE